MSKRAKLDPKTRKHLHKVLAYMVKSEAEDYYQLAVKERKRWAYHSARYLMRRFGFDDLAEWDGSFWERLADEAPDLTPRLDPSMFRRHLLAVAEQARGCHDDPVVLLLRNHSRECTRLANAMNGQNALTDQQAAVLEGGVTVMVAKPDDPEDRDAPTAVILVMAARKARELGFGSELDRSRCPATGLPVIVVEDGGCVVEELLLADE